MFILPMLFNLNNPDYQENLMNLLNKSMSEGDIVIEIEVHCHLGLRME